MEHSGKARKEEKPGDGAVNVSILRLFSEKGGNQHGKNDW